jgi:hypothetical protein
MVLAPRVKRSKRFVVKPVLGLFLEIVEAGMTRADDDDTKVLLDLRVRCGAKARVDEDTTRQRKEGATMEN